MLEQGPDRPAKLGGKDRPTELKHADGLTHSSAQPKGIVYMA
jgi:hypothetical protein